MTNTPIMQRLIDAKDALTTTIQKILDLNKSLRKNGNQGEGVEIKKELRLLNKMADKQAKIVQLYESRLKRASNQ